MYNHARTLLINLDGSTDIFSNVPGDEPIPAQYRQLNLPTYLDTFRTRLFGAKPDRAMLNYRAAQLLTMISTTKLQDHVLALDNRITYGVPRLALNSTFEPYIQRYAGNNRLTLKGKPSSPDASGVCKYDFRIEVIGGNAVVKRITWPETEETTELVITDGLSQVVRLPYSDYSFCVSSNNPAAWVIRGYLRPTSRLSDIAASFEKIGEPNLLQLFGTTQEEPYRTFKQCWENHPDLAYRLGGIVLAVIYRTEELRNG